MSIEIVLEKECDDCYGRGRDPIDWDAPRVSGMEYQRKDGSCARCHGTGKMPTSFGRCLLEFIKDHKAALEAQP